ncbi:hypothetical protein GH733_001474 [Mirounga leonina]|nr:hypothetical protein GH733_001474 [Mirounga leonina]
MINDHPSLMMLMLNQTDLTPVSFILNGIPGLEDMHMWISFPFCSMYAVAVVGNCGLLYLIHYEDSLHRPMYYFLAMLSLTDLFICSNTIPKALCIFWFHFKEISFDGCLRLPYCRGNIIPHTYCDHMSVAKLSCGNIKVNVIYGLTVALLIGGFDNLCITISYTMILRAVVSLSSADALHKAFSTCTAHICAIVFSYSAAFFSFFSHRFGAHTIPPSCHIIVANIYLLLSPTMNPIVYGVKTKHIRDCVIRIPSAPNSRSLEFILMGFPGIHSWQHWLSLPLAILYLSAIGANILVLMTICQDPALQQPMYYFLGILSVVDMA